MTSMSMSMSNSHFPAKGMPKSPPKTCGFLKYDKKSLRSLPTLTHNGTVTALNRPGSPQGSPTMYQSTMHAGSTIMQQSSSGYGMGASLSAEATDVHDAWPVPGTTIIIDLEDKELRRKSRQSTMSGKVVLRRFDPANDARVAKMKKSLRVNENYTATASSAEDDIPSLVASFSKCRDSSTDGEKTKDFGTNTELTQMRKLEFPEFANYTVWINSTVDVTVKALRKDVVAQKPADVLDFIIAWCVAKKTRGDEPETHTERALGALSDKPKPSENRVTINSSVIGRERPHSGRTVQPEVTNEHEEQQQQEELPVEAVDHMPPTSRPSTNDSGTSEREGEA